MASDDINWMAWFVVAEQMTRGEKDAAKMVAAGIRLERRRWVEQQYSRPPATSGAPDDV